MIEKPAQSSCCTFSERGLGYLSAGADVVSSSFVLQLFSHREMDGEELRKNAFIMCLGRLTGCNEVFLVVLRPEFRLSGYIHSALS